MEIVFKSGMKPSENHHVLTNKYVPWRIFVTAHFCAFGTSFLIVGHYTWFFRY